jgi:glycerophosphoryl diester phosphodiesterase
VIAVHPENSMSAFRAAHADGFTVALDVKLTADAVPVVMHDSKLDRTTDCRGRVDARTAQSLARCRLDFLGTNGVTRPNLSPERIPTLAQALEWARAKGAELTVEIEDVPARPVVDALASSGIDGEQLLVKSFRIRDLQIARDAAWRTALLTDHDDNAAAPGIASREDVDVLVTDNPAVAGDVIDAG